MKMTSKPCYQHREKSTPVRCCQTCQRMSVEYDVAERTIKALFAAGYTIVVNDGEERHEPQTYSHAIGMQPSTDAVLTRMFTVDVEHLEVTNGNYSGWILFVYGNGGYDVISDYTTNLDLVLQSVMDYVDSIAG